MHKKITFHQSVTLISGCFISAAQIIKERMAVIISTRTGTYTSMHLSDNYPAKILSEKLLHLKEEKEMRMVGACTDLSVLVWVCSLAGMATVPSSYTRYRTSLEITTK